MPISYHPWIVVIKDVDLALPVRGVRHGEARCYDQGCGWVLLGLHPKDARCDALIKIYLRMDYVTVVCAVPLLDCPWLWFLHVAFPCAFPLLDCPWWWILHVALDEFQ